MPELPEVNTVTKMFRQTVLGKRIAKVIVYDSKILRNQTAEQFVDTCAKHHFVDTYRHGKYFFGELDSGLHILFHLGMTGDLIYYLDEMERPRHTRFEIYFADGMILGYDDLRKFSRILVLSDRTDYIKKIGLGPDALRIRESQFIKLFAGRNAPVKSLLMNQKLMAGVGNLYADEVCYQARIHPASRAGGLDHLDIVELYHKMKSILKLACRRNAYYKIYPEDWFWEWRKAGTEIPGVGKVKKMKVGGRSTYYVESLQKRVI